MTTCSLRGGLGTCARPGSAASAAAAPERAANRRRNSRRARSREPLSPGIGSVCAQELRRFRHALRFDPEDRAVTALAGDDRIHRDDIDLRLGDLADHLGHRADAILACEKKAGLLLRKLQPQLPRCTRERAAFLRDEIELALAAARKTGECEQIHA